MNIITRLRQSFLKSMQLQLFISFISLPLLIGWGLPISLLTPFSTLIFGPFLTCFLLISSIIFFLELLYLPNTWPIWCLEFITNSWLACLNLEQRAWLIGFTKPPLLILLLIPLIALAAVHHKKISSLAMRVSLLACLLVGTCIILKLFPYNYPSTETITCNNGTITFINYNKTLIMIDPGFIASKPSYESYISYTLLPEIIQKTGRMNIDHLIVFKFNKRILDALQFLATKITIQHLYIPAWKGKITPNTWYSYAKLKKTVTSYNGKIISISAHKKIYLDRTSTIFIEPRDTKDVMYYDASYKPLRIAGTLNNQTITL